jgi:hypothetical protein
VKGTLVRRRRAARVLSRFLVVTAVSALGALFLAAPGVAVGPYTISGQVETGTTGLMDVTVTLSSAGVPLATTSTDMNGAYSFNDVVDGSYAVTPSKSNYTFAPAQRDYAPITADVSDADFAATLNQHTISGQITGAPNPVTVTLTGDPGGTDTTDGAGNYSFPNLPAGGNYTVTPSKANYSFTPPSSTINGLSQNETRNFAATQNQHSISGQVTKGGSPLAGVLVTLMGGPGGTDTTDGAGNYSFSGLAAGGNYTVTPSLANNTFAPPSRSYTNLNANQVGQNFAATLIRLSVGDVTVAEAGSNATFTVSLKDQNGNPVASDKDVTFNYSTVNGTAQAGPDYAARTNQPENIPVGEMSTTFQVPITDDSLDEADETFLVNLSSVVNAEVQDGSGQATITDNDPEPALSISNVSQPEGNTGVTTFLFTVTLSSASGKSVTVNFNTQNGTAVPGPGVAPQNDYQHAAGLLTFDPGQTSKTIAVLVNGDTFNETNETFFVNLSGPVNASIPPGQGAGTGTITNDDGQPALSINDMTVNEAAGNALLTVTLAPASGQTVGVSFVTSDGPAPPANAPADYAATGGALSFAPGETTKQVTVPIVQDSLDELNEHLTVTLSNTSNAALADPTGIVTITDDDNPPSLSIADASITEGDAGTTNASFILTLSAASGQPIVVTYSTVNATATAPGDYTAAASQTATFNPGETSKTISVPVVGDTLDEPNETFTVNISTPTATLADGQGMGTITDNDPAPTIAISDATVAADVPPGRVGEGNSGQGACTTAPFSQCAVFTVTLSPASGQTVTVNYATADGTATSADYAPKSSPPPLSFAPGETSKTITVAIKGDLSDEFSETFTVNLSGATNATIGDGAGTGTIVDDDSDPSAPLTLSVTGASDKEGNPEGAATVVVALSAKSPQEVRVNFGTANVSAIAGADYTAQSQILIFAPGQVSKALAIQLVNDELDEDNETFTVNLTNPQGAIITNDPQTGRFEGTGVVTIQDDDSSPSISIGDAIITEGNAGAVNASFAVTLSGVSGRQIHINHATADGTAAQPDDYAATTDILAFAPGETSKAISVLVNGDGAVEPDETFFVDLSSPTNVEIADPEGLGTIVNDDVAVVAPPPPPPPPPPVASPPPIGVPPPPPPIPPRPPSPPPVTPTNVLTGMGVSNAAVILLDNLAPIGVTCSKRARGTCFGTVTVEGLSRTLASARAKTVRLGRAQYAIRRGATEKVLVPLSRRAVKAINRVGKLRVTVVVTARDSAGKRAKAIKRQLWVKSVKKAKKKTVPARG